MGVNPLNDSYEYTTKSGLKVIYVYKKDFYKSYAGIGVKFGSADLEYYAGQEKVLSKEGLAHFIEHKLFQMPDGDAIEAFARVNATANAYTTTDKTIYYFSTVEKIYEPLEILLSMFFTPYFVREDVEKEKSIIQAEIKMYEDVAVSGFNKKILSSLYPGDPLSANVAGTVESVAQTTLEDMQSAYDTFYTTDNSYLVIISHEPKEKVFAAIEGVLHKLSLKRGMPKVCSRVKSKKTSNDFVYEGKVEQTIATLAIRMPVTNQVPLFCNYMIGILDCLFSPMAPFYQELYKKKTFTADIDYYAMTLEEAGYVVVSTTTNQPEMFLSLVKEKLSSLQDVDLDEEILDFYLRHLRAKAIADLDSIEYLGDEILSLALENISYFKEIEAYKKLTITDFGGYISYFHKGMYLKAICKKSEK